MSDGVDLLWDRPPPVDEALVASVVGWGRALLEATDAADRGLSIVLTDDPTIQALNSQWREVDAPTDVLSFPMDEGDSPVPMGDHAPLGDIVISLETAARQADGRGHTSLDEVRFLLVHGLCHLLGHDHGEPAEAALMRAEETRLLAVIAPGQRRPDTPY
ncbi:MAG: rRNA maturation RNase YbeY [Myxococcota bacterium]|nr:rRNA maturation RNase YbeY [Myxococcota bacterium]